MGGDQVRRLAALENSGASLVGLWVKLRPAFQALMSALAGCGPTSHDAMCEMREMHRRWSNTSSLMRHFQPRLGSNQIIGIKAFAERTVDLAKLRAILFAGLS
jgi:hypothetical protein